MLFLAVAAARSDQRSHLREKALSNYFYKFGYSYDFYRKFDEFKRHGVSSINLEDIQVLEEKACPVLFDLIFENFQLSPDNQFVPEDDFASLWWLENLTRNPLPCLEKDHNKYIRRRPRVHIKNLPNTDNISSGEFYYQIANSLFTVDIQRAKFWMQNSAKKGHKKATQWLKAHQEISAKAKF